MYVYVFTLYNNPYEVMHNLFKTEILKIDCYSIKAFIPTSDMMVYDSLYNDCTSFSRSSKYG
jgi:hypothetical protein